jgi:hypothetical protein
MDLRHFPSGAPGLNSPWILLPHPDIGESDRKNAVRRRENRFAPLTAAKFPGHSQPSYAKIGMHLLRLPNICSFSGAFARLQGLRVLTCGPFLCTVFGSRMGVALPSSQARTGFPPSCNVKRNVASLTR